MIVLDTSVVFELIRPAPAPQVIQWVDAHDTSDLTISSVTAAELRAGAAVLPAGRRRARITRQINELIEETFAGYVLAFDVACSRHYAAVVAKRRKLGKPITSLDAQIAAICREYGAPLATRHGNDFAGVGVKIIDPWTEPA